ncbi:hypothetical protein ACOME3_003059 [Neoechinorhynchus agilis]
MVICSQKGGRAFHAGHLLTPDSMVLACEDGTLVEYDLNEGSMQSLMIQSANPLVSVRATPNGTVIASGSFGSVFLKRMGCEQRRMRITPDDCVVWCCDFLDDSLMVCGDSLGRVHLIDVEMDEIIATIQALRSHVMTLAVDQNEHLIYCTGVDPIVNILTCTEQGTLSFVGFLDPVECDVLSMVFVKHEAGAVRGYLIYGGLDTLIHVRSVGKLLKRRHGPMAVKNSVEIMLDQPRSSIFRASGPYVAYKSSQECLQIWTVCPEKPQYVCQLKSINNAMIIDFDIRFGMDKTLYVAYCTHDGRLRLFGGRVEGDQKLLYVCQPLEANRDSTIADVKKVRFCKENSILCIARYDNSIFSLN